MSRVSLSASRLELVFIGVPWNVGAMLDEGGVISAEGFDDGEDSFLYVDVDPFVDYMSDECAEMVRLHRASKNMLLYREQSHCHVAVGVGRGKTECCRWCYYYP